MKTLNFGIEIEMTGITRANAAKAIAEYFGTTSRYVGAGYDAYAAEDTTGRVWKAMSDSSILPQKKRHGQTVPADNTYRTEVVSPILRYDDLTDLQEIVRKLRHKGAFVNDSTGIHIHIGAERFTPQTLRNLVNIIASKEDILYKALKVDAQRARRYCKKTDKDFLKAINAKKPDTMAKLADLWYEKDPCGRDTRYHSSRYHGANLHATFTKNTIEYRVFNGTLYSEEIKAYVHLCLAIAHQALTQKKASAKKTVSDNEKFTFRVWLLRLGLIGDEFAETRRQLLKNLDGDIAWRYGREAA